MCSLYKAFQLHQYWSGNNRRSNICVCGSWLWLVSGCTFWLRETKFTWCPVTYLPYFWSTLSIHPITPCLCLVKLSALAEQRDVADHNAGHRSAGSGLRCNFTSCPSRTVRHPFRHQQHQSGIGRVFTIHAVRSTYVHHEYASDEGILPSFESLQRIEAVKLHQPRLNRAPWWLRACITAQLGQDGVDSPCVDLLQLRKYMQTWFKMCGFIYILLWLYLLHLYIYFDTCISLRSSEQRYKSYQSPSVLL